MLQSAQMPPQQSEITQTEGSKNTLQGFFTASTIILVWAVSLITLLSLDISQVNTFWLLPAILLQTFIYTGLFITAHDAMHGAVLPQNPKINKLIGSIALLSYGLFSYNSLIKKHWSHHHHPGSDTDPDFHDGKHRNFFAWYFHFMKGYWSWSRLLGLMLIFNIISYTIHISERNLTLFWVIPPILSSLQLFYFGTFLPHREPKNGYDNIHFAQSTPLPIFWSFITCYHFGYHREHHEYPHVPWWRLPVIYKTNRDS